MIPAVLSRGASFPKRLRNWTREYSVSLYAGILFLLLLATAFVPYILIAVPPGNVGVLWSRFGGGTDTAHVFHEGTRLIAPWDRVTLYETRLRVNTARYDAIAANGVVVAIEATVRFHVNPPSAGLLHKLVGPNYAETLVYPKLSSLIYELVARVDPEALYSRSRATLQQEWLERARAAFAIPPQDIQGPAGRRSLPLIEIDDVLVTAVILPALVTEAIERKLQQQQIMQEYDFRIERERKEAARKRIEAEGIRDFQATVASNITPEYLRLRGVEATQAFAASPNAKTIIIGGRDGLPVILNTAEEPRGVPLSTAPAPAPK
jgi:prohibitin 2